MRVCACARCITFRTCYGLGRQLTAENVIQQELTEVLTAFRLGRQLTGGNSSVYGEDNVLTAFRLGRQLTFGEVEGLPAPQES